MTTTTIFRNPLSLCYDRVLLPACLAPPGSAAQPVPAFPSDMTTAETLDLTVIDLPAGRPPGGEALPSAGSAPAAVLRVEPAGADMVIHNGRRALRVPGSGLVEVPFPGPVLAFSLDAGESWQESRSSLADAGCPGRVEVAVESIGPCLIQWRVHYRWGTLNGALFRFRWAAGCDTVEVVEEIAADTEAAVEWHPFGQAPSRAYWWGGGEGDSPMRALTYTEQPGTRRSPGRRMLKALGHIGSFNQWCLTWAGLLGGAPTEEADEAPFVGIYSAWGGLWQRRGFVRPQVWEDTTGRAFLRFPMRQGRRLYGLVFTTRGEAGVDAADGKCLLNRRKLQRADYAPHKVHQWVLDGELPTRTPRLVDPDDLRAFRQCLAADPQLGQAYAAYAEAGCPESRRDGAPAVWLDDPGRCRAYTDYLDRESRRWFDSAMAGGFEATCIFHGRTYKALAYDVDAFWSLDLLSGDAYRLLRGRFLALAYIYADPSYCNYADYWPHTEPGEGIDWAMRDEMGDTPVPPNFGSEFFSTVGVMAELFPGHPMHAAWRDLAEALTSQFLEHLFEPDGTYHESINYHSHAIAEMGCHFYALRRNGGTDFFQHPVIKGSYRHFAEFALPPLAEGLQKPTGVVTDNGHNGMVLADWQGARRAGWPADGNSGGHGLLQEVREDLVIAARVYRDDDPELAGRLMGLWRQAGKPLLHFEQPMLAMLAMDPHIPCRETPWTSCRRQSLGVISKSTTPAGGRLWGYLRAGRATHHMDFDQGNVLLALDDRLLLADHGYHTHDTDGSSLAACATWLHNTITYAEDKNLSSGYTGLEMAPEPLTVHLADAFDWVVHRIVNTNYRLMPGLTYCSQIMAPVTVHTRHCLFVKTLGILLWDVFETLDGPATLWLHAPRPFEPMGQGRYHSGQAPDPHLEVHFLRDGLAEFERRQVGPLHCLGMRSPDAEPIVTLLLPRTAGSATGVTWDEARRCCRIDDGTATWSLRLPAPGDATELPRVECRPTTDKPGTVHGT